MDNVKKISVAGRRLKILNIGSATGRTSQALEPFGEVLSVEYDEACYLFCKEELKLSAIMASITNLPLETASFDLVCAFDVVEHVEDDKKAVAEMVRVCKPGGVVFVSVPAFPSLWSNHDVINHHYRRYLKGRLLDLFNGEKGKGIRVSYFNTILFFPVLVFRKLQKLRYSNLKAESLKSDFEIVQVPILNSIFKFIFSSERWLLKYVNFPIGVSLLYLWKKEK